MREGLVPNRAHNPVIAGSNPAPATMGLEVNKKDFDDLVKRVETGLVPTLKKGLSRALDHVFITSITRFWITPGGKGKSHASKLTVRTGRGIRSLTPAGGAFSGGGREQIRKFEIDGQKISLVGGSEVPYLAIHEYTGVKRSFVPTDRQRKFFWAKFFETGDERFKSSALAKVINQNYGPRPFWAPAFRAATDRIFGIFEETLAEALK